VLYEIKFGRHWEYVRPYITACLDRREHVNIESARLRCSFAISVLQEKTFISAAATDFIKSSSSQGGRDSLNVMTDLYSSLAPLTSCLTSKRSEIRHVTNAPHFNLLRTSQPAGLLGPPSPTRKVPTKYVSVVSQCALNLPPRPYSRARCEHERGRSGQPSAFVPNPEPQV
jgi:hypothetical protein